MIQETGWKSAYNMIVEIKHIWAIKNGKFFVACASRSPIGFDMVPCARGSTKEGNINEIVSDYEETYKKVENWLSQL